MEICNLPRGKGKTTYLVHRSHVTQFPILCATHTNAQYIKDVANKLSLYIPEPITVSEYMKEHVRPVAEKTKPEKILVDEALLILETILGTCIDTVTLTEVKERSINKADEKTEIPQLQRFSKYYIIKGKNVLLDSIWVGGIGKDLILEKVDFLIVNTLDNLVVYPLKQYDEHMIKFLRVGKAKVMTNLVKEH